MLIFSILQSVLLMAIGVMVFLFAIAHFSRVLQLHLKQKLQPLFARIGKNRFAAVGVGAGATALMQSSTATTVITVGLVNAGVVTLFQATALIMGANIGTTLTSVLIALSHLQVKYIFMSLFFVGVILRIASKGTVNSEGEKNKCERSMSALTSTLNINFEISKENTVRAGIDRPQAKIHRLGNSKILLIGNLFIGFGGIFIGLEILSTAFIGSDILQSIFYNLFASVTFPLLLILLGAVFTSIIQSSTASVALYMTMLASGILSLSGAIFLVLGSEIGTCSTTLIAGLKANTAAKQAAVMHLLFNLFSAILFAAILWPLGGYILPVFSRIVSNPALQISIFQVIYNVATVVVLIWFIKPINKLTTLFIKNKTRMIDCCHYN